MKGRILFMLFFFTFQLAFGRYWPYFAEYRNVPEDTMLLSKAVQFIHQEQLDSAEVTLLKAIARHEKHSSRETTHLIKNIYATFLFEQGDKEKALAITTEILKGQHPPSREQAFSYYTRARVFMAREQYERALESIQQGIQLLTSLQDTTPVLLYNYFFKASLSRKIGQRDQAVSILDTVRDIAYARADYNSLGTCYYEYSKLLDDYQHRLRAEFLKMAIIYFEKAGTILEEYKRLYLYSHFNLAKTYFHYLEKNEKSLAIWDKSEQLVNKYQIITPADKKRKMLWLTGIYSYRARVLTAMGKAREALESLDWQKPIVEKEYGPGSVKMSLLWANKAKAYLALEEYDSAFHYLQKVHDGRSGNHWSAISRVSNYLLPLAKTYRASGQWQKCLETAHEGICRLSGAPHGKVSLLQLPGLSEISMGNQYDVFALLLLKIESARRIYTAKKDLKFLLAAHEIGTKTDSLLQTFVANTVLWSSGVKLSTAFHQLYNHSLETSLDLHQATGKDIYKEKAFDYLCRSQSNYLQFEMQQLELLAAHDTANLAVENARLKQRIRELENRDRAGTDSLNLDKQLMDIKVRLLFNQFNQPKRTASIYWKNTATLATGQLMQEMDEKALMLAYRVNGEDSTLLLFAADRDSLFFMRRKAGSDFFRAINQFKRQVKTGYPAARVSKVLANHLLAPLNNRLLGKEKLVVIPSGPLVEIPFEAIQLSPGKGSGEPDFLIKQYAVSYHFSPNLWYKDHSGSSDPGSNPRKILAMAPGFMKAGAGKLHPAIPFRDFSHGKGEAFRAGDKLVPLPFSIKEVSSIQKIARNRGCPIKTFIHEEASIQNFHTYSLEAGILHISTHGYSSSENPLQSGIFLSPPKISGGKGQQAVGYLSLQEIYQLQTKARLVVLSACKSGYGKFVPGEGMLALPRGFLYAGVPNVMSSLWKIHDEKTKELMLLFYQYLLSGKSYAEALQLAKLRFIKKGGFPMDWAGMILIGP